jgi:hypothetical protein
VIRGIQRRASIALAVLIVAYKFPLCMLLAPWQPVAALSDLRR